MVLYALGSNGSGQLGISHTEDVTLPTRHELDFDAAPHQPVRIVGGGNHTLILTKAGELYVSGAFAGHSHGHKTLHPNTPSGQTALLGTHVQHCSVTWEASIVIYAGDVPHSYGKGERGELGRDVLEPQHPLTIPSLTSGDLSLTSHIVDVASGMQHTIMVLADGQVLGWGNGRKGQLGQPAAIVKEPRRISGIPFKVRRAVCGREFTYLIGDPTEGQHLVLGLDKWSIRSKAPTAVADWSDIGACWGSLFVLLQSGQILSWGRNDHGQLAPPGLPLVSKLACGSEHCLALTREGHVLAWGWGEHGNCGTQTDKDGDTKPGWNRIEVPGDDSKVLGIGAGCATSWIWTSSTAEDSRRERKY